MSDVTRQVLKGICLAVVIIGALTAVWWFLFGASVLSSKPIGQGEAIIQKNSAENWVKAQARFEDMYANIEAADRNIVIAFEAYERDDSTFNERNYTGLRMSCQDMVGEYNAAARKFLSEDFRSADLPYEINTMSASTDCKE